MARIKNSLDYPIKGEYYYIVDFSNYHRLRIYPVYFVNKITAQRAIDNTIPILRDRKLYYGVVRGSKIKEINMPYIFKRFFKSLKYNYPEEKTTYQQRKTYRTIMRRRLRRMGLLTLIKPKRKVTEPIKQVRLVINTQRVANSPNTIAKVIRLERKPDKYYYFIKKKLKVRIKGVLVKVKGLRLNIKTGKIEKLKFNILRKDIIIPYILTEIPPKIKHLPNYEKIEKKLRSRGFKIT